MTVLEPRFRVGDMVIDKYEKPPVPRRVKEIKITVTVEGGRTGEINYSESRLELAAGALPQEETVKEWVWGRGMSTRLVNILLSPHLCDLPVSWLFSRVKIIQGVIEAGYSFDQAVAVEGKLAYHEGINSVINRGMGKKTFLELAAAISAAKGGSSGSRIS